MPKQAIDPVQEEIIDTIEDLKPFSSNYYNPQLINKKFENILITNVNDDDEKGYSLSGEIFAEESEEDEGIEESSNNDSEDKGSLSAESKSNSFTSIIKNLENLIIFYTAEDENADNHWALSLFSEVQKELVELIESRESKELADILTIHIEPLFVYLEQNLSKGFNQKLILIVAKLLQSIVWTLDDDAFPVSTRFKNAIKTYNIACQNFIKWLNLDAGKHVNLIELMSNNLDLFSYFFKVSNLSPEEMLSETSQLDTLLSQWKILINTYKNTLNLCLYCKTLVDAQVMICELPKQLKEQRLIEKHKFDLYSNFIEEYKQLFLPLTLDQNKLRYHLDIMTSTIYWYQTETSKDVQLKIDNLLIQSIRKILEIKEIEDLFAKQDEYTVTLVSDAFRSAFDVRSKSNFYKPFGKLNAALKKAVNKATIQSEKNGNKI